MNVCEQIVRVGSMELEAVSIEACSVYASHRATERRCTVFFIFQMIRGEDGMRV